jgi:DNA invertase Pin-like site-specific DNA recombinase
MFQSICALNIQGGLYNGITNRGTAMKIGYWRQSTLHQFEDNSASERYTKELIAAGVEPENIYYDIISGGKMGRAGLDFVMKILREGDELIFPLQSRLARDEMIWADLRSRCERMRVTMISLDRGKLDITSAVGIYTSSVIAATDAFQRRLNQEQALKGMQHRRSKHLPLKPCFGYLMVNDELIINRNLYKDTGITYPEVVRIAIDTFYEIQTASGTVRALCKRFGTERLRAHEDDFPHTQSAFIDWLKNPSLIGTLVYFPKKQNKRIEIPNHHEPLITVSEWLNIQNILDSSKTTKKSDTLRNPLAGSIFCTCGSRMSAKSVINARKQAYYLYCNGAYPRCGKSATCGIRTSYGLKIQDYIDAVIDALILRSQEVAKWGCEGESEIVESPEIRELRKNITQLKSLNDPRLNDIVLADETKLNNLINAQYGERNNYLLSEHLLATSDPNFWGLATNFELRDIFRELVERVTCDRGNIIVKLKI